MTADRNPVKLKEVINKLINELGWDDYALAEQIEHLWYEVIGERLAKIAHFKNFKEGEIFVKVMDASWRTELILRREGLMKEINSKLGSDIIKEIKIR